MKANYIVPGARKYLNRDREFISAMINISIIKSAVEKEMGVSSIAHRSRKRNVVDARRVFVGIISSIYKEPNRETFKYHGGYFRSGLSLQIIADNFLDGMNHATVVHHIRTMEQFLEYGHPKELVEKYNLVLAKSVGRDSSELLNIEAKLSDLRKQQSELERQRNIVIDTMVKNHSIAQQ